MPTGEFEMPGLLHVAEYARTKLAPACTRELLDALESNGALPFRTSEPINSDLNAILALTDAISEGCPPASLVKHEDQLITAAISFSQSPLPRLQELFLEVVASFSNRPPRTAQWERMIHLFIQGKWRTHAPDQNRVLRQVLLALSVNELTDREQVARLLPQYAGSTHNDVIEAILSFTIRTGLRQHYENLLNLIVEREHWDEDLLKRIVAIQCQFVAKCGSSFELMKYWRGRGTIANKDVSVRFTERQRAVVEGLARSPFFRSRIENHDNWARLLLALVLRHEATTPCVWLVALMEDAVVYNDYKRSLVHLLKMDPFHFEERDDSLVVDNRDEEYSGERAKAAEALFGLSSDQIHHASFSLGKVVRNRYDYLRNEVTNLQPA